MAIKFEASEPSFKGITNYRAGADIRDTWMYTDTLPARTNINAFPSFSPDHNPPSALPKNARKGFLVEADVIVGTEAILFRRRMDTGEIYVTVTNDTLERSGPIDVYVREGTQRIRGTLSVQGIEEASAREPLVVEKARFEVDAKHKGVSYTIPIEEKPTEMYLYIDTLPAGTNIADFPILDPQKKRPAEIPEEVKLRLTSRLIRATVFPFATYIELIAPDQIDNMPRTLIDWSVLARRPIDVVFMHADSWHTGGLRYKEASIQKGGSGFANAPATTKTYEF